MQNTDILEKIGLSKHEILVYTTLIEKGPSKISTIVKHSGMHRPTVYQVVPHLKEIGLITSLPKGKQTFYSAESPEKLRTLFSNLQENFESLIPQLEETYKQREKKPLVKFLEGKKGITMVFDDIVRSLKKGDIFYRYTSKKSDTNADSYLPKDYREIRDKKQLERFVITNQPNTKKKKTRMERMMKVIPPEFDLFEHDITQIIYGDKVAYVDYNSKTAIIIENPMIAKFQQRLFKLLFDML